MLNKKLGVCIPTFNRDNYLKNCLDSLIPQLIELGLPIYISDNASTDDTRAIVSDFQRKYVNIFYNRNDVNLGFAPNVKKVLEMADCEFVWFLGDDDMINDSAFKKLLEYLEEGFDFLVVNSTIFDRNMESVVRERTLNLCCDITIEVGDHEKLLKTIGDQARGYLGFISSIIIRRDLLIKRILENELFLDSDFMQMELFYKSIVGKRGKVVSHPLIMNRSGNDRIKITTWAWDFPQTLNRLIPEYSKEFIQDFYNGEMQKAILFSSFLIKYQGNFGLSSLKYSLKNKDEFIAISTKALIYLIAVFPNFIFKRIFKEYKRLNNN